MSQSEPSLLLHQEFNAQARRTPGGVAIRDQDSSVTYAELESRARRMARALRERGVGEGQLVGLHVDRSIWWASSILAILQVGAAVVPLPPSYPAGRLRQIVSFASLAGVIDDVTSPLDPALASSIWHARDLATSDANGVTFEPASHEADRTAFVLCSSGSTGTPKMIVRSHRSFFHRLGWTWQRHPYEPAEVCCQKAHMTTTHSVYELFEPLLRGTPQVILSDRDVRNLEVFWSSLRRWQVSRLLIVPSALRASLDMEGFVPPHLNVVVLMGEYVDVGLAERAVAAFPDTTSLYSIYGSTEASSALVCDLRTSLHPGRELPLGQAISPDVSTQILDEQRRAVAPGQVGRLYLGGTNLFTEYLGDPELTASVRVKASDGSEWLYDTKDDVRLGPNASLEFVGRVDDTVKVRGFRVTTREVENALQAHPAVTSAAVVATNNGAAGASLIGFVCPASLDKAELRRHLRDQLPDYMVPSVIVALETFPMTASGKIDRVKLLEQRAAPAESVAPSRASSETEVRIRDAWQQVLEHDAFQLDSSFFEVGGTSLNVFAVVQRLRHAFGLDTNQLNEQAVYQFSTVEALAEHIDGIKRGDAPQGTQKAPLLVRLRKGRDPNQEPLFLIASAGGTLGAYNKLAQVLTTSREIIGVRDPFLWGEREPREDFRTWVKHYLDAIRERQPRGPYYLGAYSSAGAFGYEIACQLRHNGERVALLALIDPLALHTKSKHRYGYWVLRARHMRPAMRQMVLLGGKARAPLRRAISAVRSAETSYAGTLSETEYQALVKEATESKNHVMTLSSLFELNTSLPFALTEADVAGAKGGEYLDILKHKASELTPDVDPTTVERIAIQYKLQLRAQYSYELPEYDGDVLLVETAGPHAGLVAAQLGASVARLTAKAARVGEASERVRLVSKPLGGFATHYRTMRDDVFVSDLAGFLDPLL